MAVQTQPQTSASHNHVVNESSTSPRRFAHAPEKRAHQKSTTKKQTTQRLPLLAKQCCLFADKFATTVETAQVGKKITTLHET